MTLEEYVRQEGRSSIQRLATNSGLSYSTVYEIYKRRRKAQWETARKLSIASGEKCSIDDICSQTVVRPARVRKAS